MKEIICEENRKKEKEKRKGKRKNEKRKKRKRRKERGNLTFKNGDNEFCNQFLMMIIVCIVVEFLEKESMKRKRGKERGKRGKERGKRGKERGKEGKERNLSSFDFNQKTMSETLTAITEVSATYCLLQIWNMFRHSIQSY